VSFARRFRNFGGHASGSLIVRVRYQNPLPPPPFPPKMLNLTTSVDRFADYENLRSLETDREAPMTVDAELGMPLMPGLNDLGYWLGDRTQVNAHDAQLDEDDVALLGEPPALPGQSSAGMMAPTPLNATPAAIKGKNNPAFLRKQERSETSLAVKQEEPSRYGRRHSAWQLTNVRAETRRYRRRWIHL
jgi:RNA polymerase II-associated factor 1